MNGFKKRNLIAQTLTGKLYSFDNFNNRNTILKIIKKSNNVDRQFVLSIINNYNRLKLLKSNLLLTPSYFLEKDKEIIFVFENLQQIYPLSSKIDKVTYERKLNMAEDVINLITDLHSKKICFYNLFFNLAFVDNQHNLYLDSFGINSKYDEGFVTSRYGYIPLDENLKLPEEYLNGKYDFRTDIYFASQLICRIIFGVYYPFNIESIKFDEKLRNFVENLDKFTSISPLKRTGSVFYLRELISFRDEKSDNKEKSSYEIRFIENDVYLRILGDKKPDINEFEKKLLESNIYNYDIDKIRYVIENSNGDLTSIGEKFNIAPDNYHELIKLISDDKNICKGEKLVDHNLDVRLVKFILKKHGVMYGFLNEGIKKISNAKKGETFVLAEGKKAIAGKDAYFEIFYKNNREDINYKDLKEISFIVGVKKDQTLAIKHAATEGTDGIDIYGNIIKAKPGEDKDLKIIAGENSYITEDGLELKSSIDGYLDDSSGIINVKNFLSVYNVDYSTGNISFGGSIKISKDVNPDFSVKADEDIEIEGSVIGGNINGRNVYIKSGIYGKKISSVFAKSKLISDFIENGIIKAFDVEVYKYIIGSEIECCDMICLKGKGIIKNSKLFIKNSLSCNFLGSDGHHDTYINIKKRGEKEIRTDITKVKDSINELEKVLSKIEIKLHQIADRYRYKTHDLTEENEYENYRKKKDEYNDIIFNCNKRLKLLEEELSYLDKEQYLFVTNRIYAKTILEFNNELIVFSSDLTGPIRFFMRDGKLTNERSYP